MLKELEQWFEEREMPGAHAANDLIVVRNSGGYKISSMQSSRPSCLVLVSHGSSECRIEFDRPLPQKALDTRRFRELSGVSGVVKRAVLAKDRKCLDVIFTGVYNDSIMRKVVSAVFNYQAR